MRTLPFSTRVVVAAVLSASAGACILKTDIVGSAFNGGALDSSNDPFRVPSQLAASRVERIVEQELADGYFRQGKGERLGAWLARAQADVAKFAAIVNDLNAPNKTVGAGAVPSASSVRARDKREIAHGRLMTLAESWTESPAPLCKPATPPASVPPGSRASGVPDPSTIEAFLDGVRFRQAMSRAAKRVAALRLEGLANDAEVVDGAREAFRKTGRYLDNRKWTRRADFKGDGIPTKTAGLAVEGGAATGIFSAGAVWVVLQLIDGFMTKYPCAPTDSVCPNDITFRLISGTSTGAMVSVAVDRFSAARTHAGRQREIDHVAMWFTCYSFTDLMCVQSTGIPTLFASDTSALRGVLQFDGIQKVLTSCVKPWMFTDPAELLLNTTEFRSGRIFSLSDQDELTTRDQVVQGALASALLPVIGEPAVAVPGNRPPYDVPYDASDLARTAPAYLDGGIRSELPILPLVRRGAERVLAVASGASVISETKRMTNALEVAVRYINVNTGSVAETEIEYAQRLVESARLGEIDACMNALDPSASPTVRDMCDGTVEDSPGAAVNVKPFCNRWNICHGDFAHACEFMDAKSYEEKRADDTKVTLARRLEPFWKMDTIFVDQSNVDGLSGYDFRPSALRRLFRAGAEAARVRCLDIATLLGILPEHEPATAEQLVDVNGWCNATMKDVKTTCGRELGAAAPFAVRACDTPIDLTKLPAYLDACPPQEDPQ